MHTKVRDVLEAVAGSTQLSFYSSTLTSHSCAAKLLKQSKEEEADDRSQQWSTQFKSSHFAATIRKVFSNGGEFVKAKTIQVAASRFIRYVELVFVVFPAGLQMILVEDCFAFIREPTEPHKKIADIFRRCFEKFRFREIGDKTQE
jgi:hypothetical protein